MAALSAYAWAEPGGPVGSCRLLSQYSPYCEEGFGVTGAAISPGIAALLPTQVPRDLQGRAFGLNQAASSAGAIIGPLLGGLAWRGGWSPAGWPSSLEDGPNPCVKWRERPQEGRSLLITRLFQEAFGILRPWPL
jgi:MFS family permease